MLKGELPPRGLMGIDERSSVRDAKRAVFEAFKEWSGRECRLSHGEVQIEDDAASLGSYGVERDALIEVEIRS